MAYGHHGRHPPLVFFLDALINLVKIRYPEAGSPNISTNEGLAYSCMMMMAEGFKNILTTSNNRSGQLAQLAAGNLDQDMQPAMFNVGYVGPNGPMLLDNNGDMMTG